MQETQNEIDMRYYSRWEIAAAKEQTADGLAFIVGTLSALLIHGKYDFWVWTVAAFAFGWWFTVMGRSAETEKAWNAYENRRIIPTYDD